MNIRFACAALVALSCSSAALAASSAHDSALTKTKNVVVTERGDCVLTKWMNSSNPCGTKVEEPKKVVKKAAPAPVESLTNDQRSIYFDLNSATLTLDSQAKLDALVAAVKASTGVKKATVIGYADALGKSDHNVDLSKRRAGAVQNYLASRINIPTSTSLVEGKGATDSVTNCPSSLKRPELVKCLAKDRRVEIELDYSK